MHNAAFDALYVHIPFCVRKCGYCDFYSEVGSHADELRFLNALELELRLSVERFGTPRPRTVFFGGGTPTKLSALGLERVCDMLHRWCDLSEVVEWTSEINPGTLDDQKARALKAGGVNRASLGVQSFQPHWLALLDRSHEAGKLDEALDAARSAGIENCSLDLIYALPGQSLSEWRRDVDEALVRNVQHLSLYTLMFEDGTPLTTRMLAGELEPLDEELAATMYRETLEWLSQAGYQHYEVSNFAQPGHESLHNIAYWQCASWLGIGPSAHSALPGMRWGNLPNWKSWSNALLEGTGDPLAASRAFSEELNQEQVCDELLLMGLRLRRGISCEDFSMRSGVSIEERCGPSLDELISLGLLIREGDLLRTSERGMLLLDEVVAQLTRTPMALH